MDSQPLPVPAGYNQHDVFRLARRDLEDDSTIFQHSQPLDVTVYCPRYAAFQAGPDHLRREPPTYAESCFPHQPSSETSVTLYRSADANHSFGSFESLPSVDGIILSKGTEFNIHPDLHSFPRYDHQSDTLSMETLIASKETNSSIINNVILNEESRFESNFRYSAGINSEIVHGSCSNKAALLAEQKTNLTQYTQPQESDFKLMNSRSSPLFDPDSGCPAKSEDLLSELNQQNGNITNGIEPQQAQLNLSKDDDTNSKSGEIHDKEVEHNKMENGADSNDPSTVKNPSTENVKPALSYIALIATAILESPQQRLSLGSIYSWIETNYPFYKNRSQGWRNSVRHNLSLNDCFVKAGRCEDGKGNYWAIHPANIQDFMRGDFRQRRRSRRRGRKTTCDINLYPVSSNYLPSHSSLGVTPPTLPSFPPALNPIYSPYTEAERQAYRLDEALLRQTMNSPFVKWYHGSMPHGSFPASTSDFKGPAVQWQTYQDKTSHSIHQLSTTFSR